MTSARDSLRSVVDGLNEEEAAKVLELVRSLRDIESVEPAIELPSSTTRSFADVEPMRGEGPPASSLLISDRR